MTCGVRSALTLALTKGRTVKLVSYESGKQPALGVVVKDRIVGVGPAIQLLQKKRVPRALAQGASFKNAARRVLDAGSAPKAMIELLGRGQAWGKALAAVTLALAKVIDPGKARRGLFTPLANARLLAPIPKLGKITCVGLNDADHARVQGQDTQTAACFYLK